MALEANMGASESVAGRGGEALTLAQEWLGKEDTAAARNRFHSIASGRHSVHICALIKRMQCLKNVPAPQLGWLAAELANLTGADYEGAPPLPSERVNEAG